MYRSGANRCAMIVAVLWDGLDDFMVNIQSAISFGYNIYAFQFDILHVSPRACREEGMRIRGEGVTTPLPFDSLLS